MQPLTVSPSMYGEDEQRLPSLADWSRHHLEAKQEQTQQQQQELRHQQQSTACSGAIPRETPVKGDRLQVFSASKNSWNLDGTVMDVLDVVGGRPSRLRQWVRDKSGVGEKVGASLEGMAKWFASCGGSSPLYAHEKDAPTLVYVCPNCALTFQTPRDWSTHWSDFHAFPLVGMSAHCPCPADHEQRVKGGDSDKSVVARRESTLQKDKDNSTRTSFVYHFTSCEADLQEYGGAVNDALNSHAPPLFTLNAHRPFESHDAFAKDASNLCHPSVSTNAIDAPLNHIDCVCNDNCRDSNTAPSESTTDADSDNDAPVSFV